MNIINGINNDNLIRVQSQFESYRYNISTNRERAGAIQFFEYTYEMYLKIIKKILEQKSGMNDVYFSKNYFIGAVKAGLISNPKALFKFIEIPNLTVRTYNEQIAEQIVRNFNTFSNLINELVKNFEKIK